MAKWSTVLSFLVVLVAGWALTAALAGPADASVPAFPVRSTAPRPAGSSSASSLVVLAMGPVDLLLTDPQGRRVGVDGGQVLQEIPGAFYYGPSEVFENVELEMISIHRPLEGDYALRVTGTDAGWFDVSVMAAAAPSPEELLLRDAGTISPGQQLNYTVAGQPGPLSEREILYTLPLMKGVGEWSSVLRLQDATGAAGRAMFVLHDGWGGVEVFSSQVETAASWAVQAITLSEKLALPEGFWGAATLEDQGPGPLAPLLVAEAADRRQMASEGVSQGATALYVPYLPNGETLAVLYIQNAGDEPATLRITCRDLGGLLIPTATVTLTVAPRATTRSTLASGLPAGFAGSAVVESLEGQPLVGAVFLGDLAGKASLYSVPSSPWPTVYVPQVLKGGYGLQTFLQIQNTRPYTTQVSIHYYDANGQELPQAESQLELPAYGAVQVAQQDNASLPAGFQGAAVVKSTGGVPLSVVVVGSGGAGDDTLASSSGFHGGSALLALPYLSNRERATIFQVQNLGRKSTQVALRCYDEEGVLEYNTTVQLAPLGQAAFDSTTLPLPTDFRGAATLESLEGYPLAALAWQKGDLEGLGLYGGVRAGPLQIPSVCFLPLIAKTYPSGGDRSLIPPSPPGAYPPPPALLPLPKEEPAYPAPLTPVPAP